MEVLVDHVKGKEFKAVGSSKYPTTVDAKISSGGTGLGPTPMEMVLIAAATCSGMDITSILGKMKIAFDRFQISVTSEQAAEEPRVFTKVYITYRFWGDSLPKDKIDHAIDLTLETYCPVVAMIRKTASVEYTLEINPS